MFRWWSRISALIDRSSSRWSGLMRAFHARQFELEFLEFKKTLDLEVLSVDETLTLSVTDLHVIEQVCDDALELRVRNLEHRSVFKQ